MSRTPFVSLLTLALVACSNQASSPAPTGTLSTQAVSCVPWNASAIYVAGDTVTAGGVTYKAGWWTQGNNPATSSGPAGSGQVWTVVSGGCGTPPPPPPPSNGVLKLNETASFQVTTANFTNRYLRHSLSLGYTEIVNASSGDTLKADASFKVVAGLSDPNCFSFQSVNIAGNYLRHALGRLRIDPDNGGTFKADATFCAKAALSGAAGAVSLESKNFPGRFIRHRNAEVWVEASTGGNFNADASWKPVAAWSTTVNPPPPPPPPPPPSTGLAKHALIGYWHNFQNPSGPTYPLSQVPDTWDVINVAFAESAQAGNASFILDPAAGSEAQFIADIKAKQAKGKKVVLSLGGQNGAISVGSQAEADNFANSLYAIITKYGFNGIDLDLENGVSQGAPIQTYLPIGVKALKAKLGTGSNFYLSMAPEWVYVEGGFTASGGPWGAYIPIIDALRGDLTVLHPQYYNNGAVFTPYATGGLAAGSTDQLVATARMLIEGFPYSGKTFAGLRPDQVGFGVPSGPQSAGSGFTTPSNVNNALDCLTKLQNCGSIRPLQAYPSLRGVMTWSINWDKFDNFTFSNPVSAKLRSLP
ncbi:chitinase [Deinococcus sp.]|uniref:chitinase n=1 Tax=Deinococcus sp. TaxID=47478 RepID=UPI003B5AD1E9